MNRKTLTALIALNLALALAILATAMAPAPAEAQTRGRKAEYLMIAGDPIGIANDALVYIIDTQTAKAVVVRVSSASKDLHVIDRRELIQDFRLPGTGR